MGGLLGLPALVAGLILLLAGPRWFAGAHTVGVILTIVGGVVTLLSLLVFALAVNTIRRKF